MKIKLREWLRTTKAQDILIISLIILISIGIRVGIAYNTIGAPIYTSMATDIGFTARNMVEGKGYTITLDPENLKLIADTQAKKGMLLDLADFPPPTSTVISPYFAYPPGTSSIIALGYLISGENRYMCGRLIEAIIGSFGCLVIFLLGKELFNRKIGLIAAVIYALYLPMAYITTWVLGDALMPFFILLAFYLFVLGIRRNSIKYFVCSAAVSGIAMYFQISAIFPLLFFNFGYFIYNLGKLRFWKNLLQVTKVTAISITVFYLILTPWIIRNYHVTGNVIYLMRPGGGWQGIWEGFGEYPNPVGAVFDDGVTYKQIVAEYGSDVGYITPRWDAILREKSIKAIKEHPGWWLSVLARRLPRTFIYSSDLGIAHISRDSNGDIIQKSSESISPIEIIDTIKSAHFGKAWNIFVTYPYTCFVYGLVVLFMFVPPLLCLFAIWLMRRRWRTTALIFMAPLSFTVMNVLLFVLYKTLLPGAFFYVLFSAVALYYIAIKLKIIHDDRTVFYPTHGEV
jgi:4-amino-4-deoxy-L-arabinose transferase-like glycosyltransferase